MIEFVGVLVNKLVKQEGLLVICISIGTDVMSFIESIYGKWMEIARKHDMCTRKVR